MSSHASTCAGALPEPDAVTARHSREASAGIRGAIDAAGGHIDFSRFMDLALYDPRFGYYARGVARIGERGDFVTAPELGDLFGRCLARQCAEYLEVVPDADILEIGAGSGKLAVQVIRALAERERLPRRYRILEISASLKKQQQATVAAAAPELAHRVEWIDGFPKDPFRGILVANEVLDAMPVTRFRVASDGLQYCVVRHDGSRFHWDYRYFRDPPLGLRRVLTDRHLPVGYVSELNDRATAWIRSLSAIVEHGLLLLIDYGFPAHEFYHPQRLDGTLMCHYRHRAHTDPLINVGVQDITAHVDFSAVAAAARDSGMDVLGYTQLAPFLIGLGLPDMLAETHDSALRQRLNYTTEVKKLTMPTEMGELFKVLAVGRGIDWAPLGFSVQDHRDRL